MKFISHLADFLTIIQKIAVLILTILSIIEKFIEIGLLVSYQYDSSLERKI